jgi:hypothetical protein
MYKSFKNIPADYISREKFEHFTDNTPKVTETPAPQGNLVMNAALVVADAADKIMKGASDMTKQLTTTDTLDEAKMLVSGCDEKISELSNSHNLEITTKKEVIKNYEFIIFTQFFVIFIILAITIYNLYTSK